jgi:signal transduction histidine kinase
VRPLDFLGSIKLKLGVVIVAAVVVNVHVVAGRDRARDSPLVAAVIAVAAALALVQVLAHGMTYPLREMVGAARAMARGEYGRRVTATSRDEVGELARAFNAMAAELAETDRVRRDLVANASHELRTPLGALRATLENLVDGVEAASPETLSAMLAQVERLGMLVEQLLDLSKLESGVVPLARQEIRAADLLERVVAEWRPHAAQRDVSLLTAVEPEALVLRVDGGRIRQVLGNLVANAIRHSPPGGEVTARARLAGDTVVVEVADDGPGIPPAEAERVFERFYRADQARASDGGAGLGLAIARWIVELHGGRIRVDGTGANGCRMVVELPR